MISERTLHCWVAGGVENAWNDGKLQLTLTAIRRKGLSADAGAPSGHNK